MCPLLVFALLYRFEGTDNLRSAARYHLNGLKNYRLYNESGVGYRLLPSSLCPGADQDMKSTATQFHVVEAVTIMKA